MSVSRWLPLIILFLAFAPTTFAIGNKEISRKPALSFAQMPFQLQEKAALRDAPLPKLPHWNSVLASDPDLT
jgi:hypothetical protein